MKRRDFGRSALAALCLGGISGSSSFAHPRNPPHKPPHKPPRNRVLWHTNYEAGNIKDWSKTVGSVVSGGNFSDSPVNNADLEVNITRRLAHSGCHAVETRIKAAVDKTIGVRLLRWRDDSGKPFPESAYYSTWMYVPHNYTTVAGWWNIFQFKSQRPDNSTSDIILSGNLDGDGHGYKFYFFDHIKQVAYEASTKLRAKKWVHLEAWFKYDTSDGAIKYWQDGKLLINQTGLQTKTTESDQFLVWGIGNYTSGIEGHPRGPGIADLYFDEAVVSTFRRGLSREGC